VPQGPLPLMYQAYAKHGQVFTVPMGIMKMTFLLGSEVTEHFFKAKDSQLSQEEIYNFNVPTFGPNVVFDVNYRERAEQFRFFSDSLKSNKLKKYVGDMVTEASAFFEQYTEPTTFNVLDKFSELIILTASTCILGREVRENLFNEVYKHFHDLDNGMLPISVLAPRLPIKAHKQRDQARHQIREIFSNVQRERRNSGRYEEDLLQTFMDAEYRDGSKLSEEQVTGLLVAALFAGQHTSSITSTWSLLHLLHDSKSFEKATREQQRIMAKHGETIDYDVLQEMDCLHRVVKEALRLHPPLMMLMRYVREPFEVTDRHGRTYRMPKGRIVATSPTFAHRLSHVYSNPDSFDPERFSPERKEDEAYGRFSFIGFGGGRHGCMGEPFAYLQVKTILAHVIRNFNVAPQSSKLPADNYDAMVVGPRKGPELNVTFKPRKLQPDANA
jgi:sterol 14-demethylase